MKKIDNVNKSRSAAPRLKGWKRWAFPLAAMLLIPAGLFGLTEAVLRAIDYGYPTKFFVKRTVANSTVYTENRQYGWRFFPPKVARRPADFMLPAPKGDNTFRVFVLGESAAMGDPDPAYSIPRILEVMLSEHFPSVRFEVVNAAMTGISSHVIRDIAKNCARLEPDCFVVYMGNNEAIGPYGPGTVFASFSKYLPLTRLSVAARTLKTSQLADAAIRSRAKAEDAEAWGGLRVFMKSQFHPSDARVALLADHFESNLRDICAAGQRANAKLVLCSVASNLKDCSPFASVNNPALTADQKATWASLWDKAEKLERDGKTEAALAAYTEAEAVDSTFAELHFRKGLLYTRLQRSQEAHQSFVRARDYDALKFRTSSDLNAITRKVAQGGGEDEVAFADVVTALEKESGATGVGSNHFLDHVHFNFRGNYLAAREMFAAVSRFVPATSSTGAAAKVLTEQECVERLAFTPWNNARITQYMLKRYEIPPFNSKSDYPVRAQELRSQVAALKSATEPAALKKAVTVYEKALQRKKNDAEFLRSLAELHADLTEWSQELKYRKTLCELFPYDEERKAFLADASARAGDHAAGERLALEVLKEHPSQVIARLAYATALHKKGAIEEAITQYKEVLRLRPDYAEVQRRLNELATSSSRAAAALPGAPELAPVAGEANKHFKLGETLLEQGNIEAGIQQLRMAVRLQPAHAEAQMALAGILIEQGKVEEAITQSKEALEARPDFVQLHNNLGALLTDLGRYAEGRTHLEEVLRMQPEHEDAQLNLGLNFMRDKQPGPALVHLEQFSRKNPDDHALQMQIGLLHESVGNWQKAARSYAEALRLQPTNGQYQCSLAWLLATSPEDGVRNGAEAVRLAEAACQSGREVYFLDTLAAAFAEAGRYPEAVKMAEDALAMSRAAEDGESVKIGKRVALYRNNQPYRTVATAP